MHSHINDSMDSINSICVIKVSWNQAIITLSKEIQVSSILFLNKNNQQFYGISISIEYK